VVYQTVVNLDFTEPRFISTKPRFFEIAVFAGANTAIRFDKTATSQNRDFGLFFTPPFES
jgi:hypothetical protein